MIYCMTTREPATIIAKLRPARPAYPVDGRVWYPDGREEEMSAARLFGHGWDAIEEALRAAPFYIGRR